MPLRVRPVKRSIVHLTSPFIIVRRSTVYKAAKIDRGTTAQALAAGIVDLSTMIIDFVTPVQWRIRVEGNVEPLLGGYVCKLTI